MNINKVLNRESIAENIKQNLIHFEKNKSDLSIIRGIYLYGECGIGKTYFIHNVLKELNYDIIIYDSSDVRNKAFIESITKYKRSNINVLSMFNKKIKNIAIIMDEIDSMNTGDKGGITSLIKIIRPKKTKKQKLKDISNIPIICIGNNLIEKKLQALSKVCHTYHLISPNVSEKKKLCLQLFDNTTICNSIYQNSIRQIFILYKLYSKNKNIFLMNIIQSYLGHKSNYDNTKLLTKKLLNEKTNIKKNKYLINETDRTTVALLLHENIIDKFSSSKDIFIYKKILSIYCFCDYLDRITFQKQIWQLNEMSSLLKIFNNMFILHNSIFNKKNINEIRFTKILTKYSTEYNNYIFIQELCQKLDMDKKDLFLYFNYIMENENMEEELISFYKNNINKLDINRMYKLLKTNLLD